MPSFVIRLKSTLFTARCTLMAGYWAIVANNIDKIRFPDCSHLPTTRFLSVKDHRFQSGRVTRTLLMLYHAPRGWRDTRNPHECIQCYTTRVSGYRESCHGPLTHGPVFFPPSNTLWKCGYKTTLDNVDFIEGNHSMCTILMHIGARNIDDMYLRRQ